MYNIFIEKISFEWDGVKNQINEANKAEKEVYNEQFMRG